MCEAQDRVEREARKHSELKRTAALRRTAGMRRGAGFAASTAQRQKVARQYCIACCGSPVDPAHLCPRAHLGCADPRCVIPLCRRCHREYDAGRLDLLPYFASFRTEFQHALEHLDPLRLLHVVTGVRWAPEREAA